MKHTSIEKTTKTDGKIKKIKRKEDNVLIMRGTNKRIRSRKHGKPSERKPAISTQKKWVRLV
jgi:hypothetical protein